MSLNFTSPTSLAITGAAGNLGVKLFKHLATRSHYTRFVGLDVRDPDPDQIEAIRQTAIEHHRQAPQIDYIRCDLTDWYDRRWRDVFEDVDAVVHFAADNPYPEATWTEVTNSLDMTLHVAHAAADSQRLTRFVFATSNHVMGRYKDLPRSEMIGPGELTPEYEVGVGTVWHTGVELMDSTPYAVAKFAGERICTALGKRDQGKTTFVCVRIGWCQPGENRPDTLSTSGSPTLQSGQGRQGSQSMTIAQETMARAERWFKGMWLSNRDFTQLFERAIEVDGSDWPDYCIIVNGMSNNTGMAWSLKTTRQYLGYEPQDDVQQV